MGQYYQHCQDSTYYQHCQDSTRAVIYQHCQRSCWTVLSVSLAGQLGNYQQAISRTAGQYYQQTVSRSALLCIIFPSATPRNKLSNSDEDIRRLCAIAAKVQWVASPKIMSWKRKSCISFLRLLAGEYGRDSEKHTVCCLPWRDLKCCVNRCKQGDQLSGVSAVLGLVCLWTCCDDRGGRDSLGNGRQWTVSYSSNRTLL